MKDVFLQKYLGVLYIYIYKFFFFLAESTVALALARPSCKCTFGALYLIVQKREKSANYLFGSRVRIWFVKVKFSKIFSLF